MALRGISLVQGVQLPGSVAAQYTCPANQSVVLRRVVFTNTTTGAVAVTAYVVPSGGSAGDPTTVLSALSIAAHAAYVSSELDGLVLNAGDSLQCFASAATSISLQASGVQQT